MKKEILSNEEEKKLTVDEIFKNLNPLIPEFLNHP